MSRLKQPPPSFTLSKQVPSGQAVEPRAFGSRLAIARRIIAEHCQLAGLTPGMVAHSMYVSTRTLHRIFEESGESFRAVLLHERLDRCQRALRDPAFADQFISTIAYQCGFESLATFNRQFQAAFGVTPNAWRNGKL